MTKDEICVELEKLYQQQLRFVQPMSADDPDTHDQAEFERYLQRREQIRQLEDELCDIGVGPQ